VDVAGSRVLDGGKNLRESADIEVPQNGQTIPSLKTEQNAIR
jgi:hypothetical protein